MIKNLGLSVLFAGATGLFGSAMAFGTTVDVATIVPADAVAQGAYDLNSPAIVNYLSELEKKPVFIQRFELAGGKEASPFCNDKELDTGTARFDYQVLYGAKKRIEFSICTDRLAQRASVLGRPVSAPSILIDAPGLQSLTLSLPEGGQRNDDNCGINVDVDQKLCLKDSSLRIYGSEPAVILRQEPNSFLKSLSLIENEPNCAVARFHLQGRGQDEILGVKNCKGHAEIRFTVNVYASPATSAALQQP